MPKTVKPDPYSKLQAQIGERMKWARELVEPNRTEVARIMGVDPSTLAKNEDGERAPSIYTVIQYANRFRVSTDYLLRGQLIGRIDEEMRLKLAALHPELVLPQKNTDVDTDTDGEDGTSGRPRTRVRLDRASGPTRKILPIITSVGTWLPFWEYIPLFG